MSTCIKTIKGRYEHIDGFSELTPTYKPAELNLVRFSGGSNGRMLQLTIKSNTTTYIQLTQEQVKELTRVLKDFSNDEKHFNK